MNFVLHPWYIVLLALSAMIERERDKAIDYLLIENHVLREKLGKGRILLNTTTPSEIIRVSTTTSSIQVTKSDADAATSNAMNVWEVC